MYHYIWTSTRWVAPSFYRSSVVYIRNTLIRSFPSFPLDHPVYHYRSALRAGPEYRNHAARACSVASARIHIESTGICSISHELFAIGMSGQHSRDRNECDGTETDDRIAPCYPQFLESWIHHDGCSGTKHGSDKVVGCESGCSVLWIC
jgi:hypothetical protein